MGNKSSAYAKSGVDIELGNRIKESLPSLLESTKRPEVLGEVGGFGGLFALNTKNYKQPVLVSSADGVGTKLKVAFMTKKHFTIGQDLVNHCVNDIAILGAEALFFLDYLGTGKLTPKVFQDILRGFAIACAENNCSLLGGETAQMPGFYQKGEYDVSGTIVGIVDKKKILDGSKVKEGDLIIGIESNGLHTNGYSLARNVLFDKMGLKISSKVSSLGKKTIGQELLRIHRSYGQLIAKLLKTYNKPKAPSGIKAMAHITGGGFYDNIPRNLPENLDALVDSHAWTPQPIFQLIQEHGKISNEEMFHVFNMGIGLTCIVAPKHSKKIAATIKRNGFACHIIRRINKGSKKVSINY